MDIYRPEAPGRHPAVILIHGGGWIGGNKSGHQGTGMMLARHGYVACSIDYRLGPEFPYPAGFDDCQRSVRWVRAHAKEYGIDPHRVAVMGDSAGGHLVGLMGVRRTRDNSDPELSHYSSRPDAVISYYGCFELVRMWDIEMAHKPLTAWLGGAPQGREGIYAETSPIVRIPRSAPPFLVVHGDADKVNPVEQSQMFHEALRKHGVESTLVIIPGAGHGWAPDSPAGRQAEGAVLAFLEKQFGAR
jgi:acetyl esterase/lipase